VKKLLLKNRKKLKLAESSKEGYGSKSAFFSNDDEQQKHNEIKIFTYKSKDNEQLQKFNTKYLN
jgi:hypothetical protein